MKLQSWNLVFFIGFIVFVIMRGVFKERTKGNVPVIRRMDAMEKALLAMVFPTTLLFPVLHLFTPWLSFADYSPPRHTPWLGAVLMALSLWLFWRSHVDLGRNWSVTLEVREGHQVIQHGVYRLIRHPMYASIWLWCLAQGLLLDNWLAGWGALAAFALMYFIRTPREERLMCEVFGQEYRDYMGRTGRIIPRLKRGGGD